jgi:hypothetical protein
VRGERDFEAYVAARGATVLRCLLLIGADLAAAEDTATSAFAAIRQEWWALSEAGDPDVVLWAGVLASDERRRRRVGESAPGETELVRVLREHAGLDEVQVAEVLGLPTSRVRAASALPVPLGDEEDEPAGVFPVPYARVRAAAGRNRRRRWLQSAGVAAATALVLALASWLARPEPLVGPGDALDPAAARVEDNAANVVWWADGQLHLPSAVLEVSDVRRLVAVGAGAAYVDSRGRLVGAEPDGTRTLLGEVADGSALVSSPGLGLVAWVDVSVPGLTRLVVWDLRQGREVAAVVTRPGVRPITFDGGWLRFGQGLKDWAWDPRGGPAQLTGDGFAEEVADRTALVDAVAGTRLEQWGTFLRVVRSGRQGETHLPGFGGSLSPDGGFVLTGPQQRRQPRLVDTRTGLQVEVWSGQDVPRGAVFDTAGGVAWVVEDDETGLTRIASCTTTSPVSCHDSVELGKPDRVVLADDSRR